PAEGTDGNRVYTPEWWIDACTRINERGWRINLLGRPDHPAIRKICAAVAIEQVFEPTISGLRACVAASSRAIGGSTGPTWALLKLIGKCHLGPGDIVMLTPTVRDLHRAPPGQFITDVRTSAGALWENNPHLVPLDDRDPAVETIDMHYPLIHESNTSAYHFI